jgi:hypothetical protein
VIARLIVLLFAALVLAGCGGGDDEEPRAKATPSPTPALSDTTLSANSVLKVSDFPAGWTEEPDPRPDETRCEEAKAALDSTSGHTDSGRFTDRTFPSVIGSVYLYADEAAAEQAFEALGSVETHECVGEEFASVIAEQLGIEIGEVESEPLSLEGTAGSRLTVPATVAGLKVDAVFDVLVARSGRGITFWVFGSSQTPFDEALRDQLIGTAVDRLTENLSG